VNFAMLLSTDFFDNEKSSTLIYCQKNQRLTLKVSFIASGQFSALITLRCLTTDDLVLSSTNSTDQINGTYFLKVTCPTLHLTLCDVYLIFDLQWAIARIYVHYIMV
jgi:hypothetical protein